MSTDNPAPVTAAELRLYRMMQHLMTKTATQGPTLAGPYRDTVDKADALAAATFLAAVIDESTQAGRLPAGRGEFAASALMVIREWIEPLPSPEGDEELLLVSDLEDVVSHFRQIAREHGPLG